jgi:hypothetical protein
MPPNWAGKVRIRDARTIVQNDGIPLVWVPRSEIILEMISAAKTYRVRLPKDIPAARFWSFTVYDNQTRSMLQTPQRYPRAGSQEYPSPAAEAEPDGSTVVYFAPTQPDDVAPGNWIQTDPEKGWFVVLRFYSPLQAFFDKTWQPGEVELVT